MGVRSLRLWYFRCHADTDLPATELEGWTGVNLSTDLIQNAFEGPIYSLGEWEHLLAERFVPGKVTLTDGGPAGRLHSRFHARTHRLWGEHLSVWPQAIMHSTRHLSALSEVDKTSVIAHVVIQGTGFIEQGDVYLPFRTGDISFRNLAESSRVVFETPATFYAIRLPSTILNTHYSGRTDGHHIRPKIAQGGAMPSQMTQLLLSDTTTGAEINVADFYVSLALPWLFAAVYHGDVSRDNQKRLPNLVRWQQILGYINEHLFDADAASSAVCAQAIGISERYLHKLFAQRGLCFSRTVLERRLDAAHSLLKCAAYRQHSIASIAYQCGFNDPAYFSRSFRKRYGESPRQCRNRPDQQH